MRTARSELQRRNVHSPRLGNISASARAVAQGRKHHRQVRFQESEEAHAAMHHSGTCREDVAEVEQIAADSGRSCASHEDKTAGAHVLAHSETHRRTALLQNTLKQSNNCQRMRVAPLRLAQARDTMLVWRHNSVNGPSLGALWRRANIAIHSLKKWKSADSQGT